MLALLLVKIFTSSPISFLRFIKVDLSKSSASSINSNQNCVSSISSTTIHILENRSACDLPRVNHLVYKLLTFSPLTFLPLFINMQTTDMLPLFCLRVHEQKRLQLRFQRSKAQSQSFRQFLPSMVLLHHVL